MKRAKNENVIKKLTTIIFSLVAVILIIVGFVGVYIPKQNKLVNIVPDYTLGTELYGVMEYRLSPDDTSEEKKVYVDDNGNIKGEVVESEESSDASLVVPYNVETRTIKANEEKDLNKKNYEKVKSILDERLKICGATDYSIRMNNVTGDMVVEISTNDDLETIYATALDLKGKFRVTDHQTGVVLLDNTNIKTAYSTVNQISETGYVVYLQIELNEEGTKILKDISNTYREYTTSDGQTKKDVIDITLDDMLLTSTYFKEEYNSSVINIALTNELTNTDEINDYANQVADLAEVINLGELPITYVNDSQLFIKSSVQEETLNITFIIMYVILVIALVGLTIKFKLSGLIAGILNAGFVALVTIILRYLEVVISISSLMALFVTIGLNIMFLYIYLSNKKDDESFSKILIKYYLTVMPVIIISFVFTFFVNEAIAGIGNVLFWALLIQIIYNFVFTRFTINDK